MTEKTGVRIFSQPDRSQRETQPGVTPGQASTSVPDEAAPPAAQQRKLGRIAFGVLALGYVVIGVGLLPMYRYQLNPDGVAYLNLAEHYWNGRWPETVNGLWSPMFSWLLAPLIGAGVDPQLASRGVNLAGGLLTLVAVWALAARYTDQLRLRLVAAVIMLPVILGWAFALTTPDVLLVAALLWYLYVLTSPRLAQGLRFAALAGLVGGVAYLTKGYAFPFFIVHFIGYTAWQAFWLDRPNRGAWLRRMATGLGCFAVVSGPWVALLSLKYGHLTQSTTTEYNWKVVGPKYLGEHPTYRPGLLDPASAHATSAWQDPTTIPMDNWSALRNPVFFAKLVASNVWTIVETLQRFSLLAAGLIVLGILFSRLRPGLLRDGERNLLHLTGFTLLLLVGGYAIVKLEPRYIWTATPLLVLAGVLMVGVTERHRFLSKLGLLLAVAFVVGSFWLPAARDLAVQRHTGAPNAVTSADFKHQVPQVDGQNFASNAEPRVSLYLAYLTNAHYYGLAPTEPDEALAALREKNIRYFLYWGDPAQRPAYLANAPVVFEQASRKLTVYEL